MAVWVLLLLGTRKYHIVTCSPSKADRRSPWAASGKRNLLTATTAADSTCVCDAQLLFFLLPVRKPCPPSFCNHGGCLRCREGLNAVGVRSVHTQSSPGSLHFTTPSSRSGMLLVLLLWCGEGDGLLVCKPEWTDHKRVWHRGRPQQRGRQQQQHQQQQSPFGGVQAAEADLNVCELTHYY